MIIAFGARPTTNQIGLAIQQSLIKLQRNSRNVKSNAEKRDLGDIYNSCPTDDEPFYTFLHTRPS